MKECIFTPVLHFLNRIVETLPQQFLCILTRNGSLQEKGKQHGNDESDQHFHKKRALEPVRYGRQFRAAFRVSFHLDQMDHRNRNRYRSRIDSHHRNRAHFDIHECTAHIRDVGEENGKHMQDFAYHTDKQRLIPCRKPVAEHMCAQHCRDDTRHDGGNRTAKACVITGAPVDRKPALHTADHTGNHACRSAEDKTCAKRSRISGIDHGALKRNTELGAADGNHTEDDADDDLFRPIGKIPQFCLMEQVIEDQAYNDRNDRDQRKRKIHIHQKLF